VVPLEVLDEFEKGQREAEERKKADAERAEFARGLRKRLSLTFHRKLRFEVREDRGIFIFEFYFMVYAHSTGGHHRFRISLMQIADLRGLGDGKREFHIWVTQTDLRPLGEQVASLIACATKTQNIKLTVSGKEPDFRE
jgi:hypothetical protein